MKIQIVNHIGNAYTWASYYNMGGPYGVNNRTINGQHKTLIEDHSGSYQLTSPKWVT